MNALIDAPGAYTDVTAAQYHADCVVQPSLSSSIAKVLVSKTPRHAWFQHPRLNPAFAPEDRAKFDLGTVAHELILGKGGGYTVLPFNDYKGAKAKAERSLVLAEGKTPILAGQFEDAMEIAKAVMSAGLVPKAPETVLVWREGDAWARAMLDDIDGAVIRDFKVTGVDLSDESLGRQIASPILQYDLSAAFYVRGFAKLFPQFAGRVRFLWTFIETSEPFEMRTIEADATTLEMGRRKAEHAIRSWQRCTATGVWPGYSREPARIEYPAWSEKLWIEREIREEAA